jgi:hypothetical protein
MDLFAAGFNAWHQLVINRQISKDEPDEEPHDLYRFTKVLSASTIKRPVSRLTYTIGIALTLNLDFHLNKQTNHKQHSDSASLLTKMSPFR